MRVIRTDRSRVEAYQRCPRARYLEYSQDSTGIVAARRPLPLVVGSAVHAGLASLLEYARLTYDDYVRQFGTDEDWPVNEDQAVEDALRDFALESNQLELPTEEEASLSTIPAAESPSFDDMLRRQAEDLGMSQRDIAALGATERNGRKEYDEWLRREQAGLVEGLVRAYARRRLRPLLEEYEVLEVEREGEWELASWNEYEDESFGHDIRTNSAGDAECIRCHQRFEFDDTPDQWCPATDEYKRSIRFMSRPDALLRNRHDNSLYLQSFKTASSWDIRKARDAEHDMQGLSEGVEVEKRLGEWWHDAQSAKAQQTGDNPDYGSTMYEAWGHADSTPAMFKYLLALPAPPRILGIRYEYLLKSYRGKDKDLSARFGLPVWSQRSHLLRAYQSTKNADQLNWSWDFVKDDGSAGKLAWQSWRSRSLDELGLTIRQWIDKLDQSEMAMSAYDSTVGQEPREMGWRSAAQATGFTAEHPLDSVFVPPIVIYRSDDQLRDLVEQLESQERRVAESVARVESAADEDERRSVLNTDFIQSRHACSYPTECQFVKICYGGDDIRRDPLTSGLYVRRTPNHPQESGDTK